MHFADYQVIRLGFEPKTHSLEGCCSIQLSYRTDPKVAAKVIHFSGYAICLAAIFLLLFLAAYHFAGEFDAGDEAEADEGEDDGAADLRVDHGSVAG